MNPLKFNGTGNDDLKGATAMNPESLAVCLVLRVMVTDAIARDRFFQPVYEYEQFTYKNRPEPDGCRFCDTKAVLIGLFILTVDIL